MNIAVLINMMCKQVEDKLELEDLFQEIEDLNNIYYEERKEYLKDELY